MAPGHFEALYRRLMTINKGMKGVSVPDLDWTGNRWTTNSRSRRGLSPHDQSRHPPHRAILSWLDPAFF